MKSASRNATSRAARLSASDWIDAALLTMGRRGIANVRVERLARDLKVTKGSFYWHFRNREALLDAMLLRYQQLSLTEGAGAAFKSARSPLARLKALLNAPQADPNNAEVVRMELAIRLWARRSEHVRKMVRKLDRARLAMSLRLLAELGIRAAGRKPLAHALQALMFYLWTADDLHTADRKQLVDMVLATARRMARRTA
jgi:AcrR family transcriptional regulator